MKCSELGLVEGSFTFWLCYLDCREEKPKGSGMKRKVAKQSAALECNEVKRKPPAAGFVRQTIHALCLRRVAAIFVVFPTDSAVETEMMNVLSGWVKAGSQNADC